MQLMLLADTDVDEPADGEDSTTSDDVTGEFLHHIADTLRRKSTLAGRTLDRFLAQTKDRSQLGDDAGIPDHTPVSFTGSRTSICSDAMKRLSFHLFNIASFLTNVTVPRILTTTAATTPTPTSSTTLSEATGWWKGLRNMTINGTDDNASSTLPPCACPTLPPPPTAGPVYSTPVLVVSDLAPVRQDIRGYLDRSDTVDECLAGYGKALSKTADWRAATRTAARLLRSDAGQGDAFDFAAEVSALQHDESDVETLFYRYAYAQVRPVRRRQPGRAIHHLPLICFSFHVITYHLVHGLSASLPLKFGIPYLFTLGNHNHSPHSDAI